jgi:hypothetical protein
VNELLDDGEMLWFHIGSRRAHRIDGHPEFGYGIAHPKCNECAKR